MERKMDDMLRKVDQNLEGLDRGMTDMEMKVDASHKVSQQVHRETEKLTRHFELSTSIHGLPRFPLRTMAELKQVEEKIEWSEPDSKLIGQLVRVYGKFSFSCFIFEYFYILATCVHGGNGFQRKLPFEMDRDHTVEQYYHRSEKDEEPTVYFRLSVVPADFW